MPRYCELDPDFAEAFSLTRRGLCFKGSHSWFGGYCTYSGGSPLVDAVIANLRESGAKDRCLGTDSMMNQFSYELIYASPRACLLISSGNTFCGGKGAWLSGVEAAAVALNAVKRVRDQSGGGFRLNVDQSNRIVRK